MKLATISRPVRTWATVCLSSPDALHADDLYSRLGQTRVIGREIQVFQETTSTNDVAARLARGSAAEGAVVFAESQSKGRGRMGRTWLSPAGKGLWFTVLLRPDIPPQRRDPIDRRRRDRALPARSRCKRASFPKSNGPTTS